MKSVSNTQSRVASSSRKPFSYRCPLHGRLINATADRIELMDFFTAAAVVLGLWTLEVALFLVSYRGHSRG